MRHRQLKKDRDCTVKDCQNNSICSCGKCWLHYDGNKDHLTRSIPLITEGGIGNE